MLNLKLKVRPDPFTGRTFNYMTPAATDLWIQEHFLELGRIWEGYICLLGRRRGATCIFGNFYFKRNRNSPCSL